VSVNRRATASAAALLLLTAGLGGCTSDDDDAPAGRTEVVIGADLASGSAVDTAYARALQLMIEQVNNSGSLGDRQLVLRIQDNRSDPTSSLRNISTFADDPAVVAVVAGACSECVVGAAKTINDKRIPTIALAPADRVSAPVAKLKKVAILHTDDLYGKGGVAALTAELDKAGIDISGTRAVKPTATDITQTVGTLVDTEPNALLFLVGPDQAGLAPTSAKAAGFTGQVYLDANAAGDLFIPQDAAAATDNTMMVFTQILAIDDVISTTPAKAARKQWFRDYTSRYGSYSGVASFAADAANLIGDAVAQAGGDREQVRSIIETSQIDGLSGPIRITPDNHSGLMPQALTMLVARSGRWRLLS
jgi:branched-chain amino acid transport system substrate-binding protein